MKKIYKPLAMLSLGLAFMGITVTNPAPNLFSNLFGSNATFQSIIAQVVDIILGFAGLIAMLYIILGGYQFITSAGNSDQAEKGRKTLTNAIIGLVIIILSFVIIRLVVTNL